MGWALDLDGVVWLGREPIAGAASAVGRLRLAGEHVLFVTNNSYATRSSVAAKLVSNGVPATEDDVVTSALAAAALVEPGETVLVCGGPGVREEVRRRGAVVVEQGPADVVVVGYDPAFDYSRMSAAASAVRGGARLVATNDDATYPTPEGPVPGGGAILASIERASGCDAAVAGKPHAPMCEIVRAALGPAGTMVGDRPETDGSFARAMGYRFVLVLSGVTLREHLPVDPAPDLVAETLADVVG